jgi:transposase
MDTMTTDKKRTRRAYSAALKAQILAECAVPGASVARVAMSHGINDSVVHTWRRLAREQSQEPTVVPTFTPLTMPPVSVIDERIRVEIRRGALSMTMDWPMAGAAGMAACLRELLR